MIIKRRKKFFSLALTICLILTQMLSGTTAFAQSSQPERLAGTDRYKTAVAVSQYGWPGTSEYAVLVRGDVFADSLCAGPLAKKYNAPVLLTQPNILLPEVLEELKRLKVSNVIIIGGTGAISTGVEDSLKAAGIVNIERIFGADRYATSVEVAKRIGTTSTVALALCTGLNYPDALSISSIAIMKNMPVLLTEKDSLPGVVSDYISSIKPTQSYIIGGMGVISDSVVNAISGAVRLGGSDRYQTNAAVIKAFESELNFDKVYIIVGDGLDDDDFADALIGSVLAARTNSPVILIYKTMPDATWNYLKTKLTRNSTATAIGGEAVVPQAILNMFKQYAASLPVDTTPSGGGGGGGTVLPQITRIGTYVPVDKVITIPISQITKSMGIEVSMDSSLSLEVEGIKQFGTLELKTGVVNNKDNIPLPDVDRDDITADQLKKMFQAGKAAGADTQLDIIHAVDFTGAADALRAAGVKSAIAADIDNLIEYAIDEHLVVGDALKIYNSFKDSGLDAVIDAAQWTALSNAAKGTGSINDVDFKAIFDSIKAQPQSVKDDIFRDINFTDIYDLAIDMLEDETVDSHGVKVKVQTEEYLKDMYSHLYNTIKASSITRNDILSWIDDDEIDRGLIYTWLNNFSGDGDSAITVKATLTGGGQTNTYTIKITNS